MTPRRQAIANGQKTYFTGEPCLRGHVANRSVKGGDCLECRKVYHQTRVGDGCKNSEHKDKYPNGRCANCTRARALKWQKNHPQRIKLRKQKCAGLPVASRPMPDTCEACGNEETKIHHASGKPQSLSLDHCHSTGKFRGWLCDRCNRGLGTVGEDIYRLKALIGYIETWG